MLILKNIIFSILVPGTVTVGIPFLLLKYIKNFSYNIGFFKYIGILPIGVGIVFYILSIWDFALIGKGTPAPIDPPKVLIKRRIYKITRNPMYLSGLFILIGEGLFFQSIIIHLYTIIIGILFHLFVIFYEEPHLKKKFGKSYEQYCKEVPRWFFK